MSDRYIDTYGLTDGSERGLLHYARALEEEIFEESKKTLQSWRQSFPTSLEIRNFQEDQTF
jgi:hypothetical protein